MMRYLLGHKQTWMCATPNQIQRDSKHKIKSKTANIKHMVLQELRQHTQGPLKHTNNMGNYHGQKWNICIAKTVSIFRLHVQNVMANGFFQKPAWRSTLHECLDYTHFVNFRNSATRAYPTVKSMPVVVLLCTHQMKRFYDFTVSRQGFLSLAQSWCQAEISGNMSTQLNLWYKNKAHEVRAHRHNKNKSACSIKNKMKGSSRQEALSMSIDGSWPEVSSGEGSGHSPQWSGPHKLDDQRWGHCHWRPWPWWALLCGSRWGYLMPPTAVETTTNRSAQFWVATICKQPLKKLLPLWQIPHEKC